MIIYSTVLESFNLPVYQMVLHVLPYFQQPTKEREKKKKIEKAMFTYRLFLKILIIF